MTVTARVMGCAWLEVRFCRELVALPVSTSRHPTVRLVPITAFALFSLTAPLGAQQDSINRLFPAHPTGYVTEGRVCDRSPVSRTFWSYRCAPTVPVPCATTREHRVRLDAKRRSAPSWLRSAPRSLLDLAPYDGPVDRLWSDAGDSEGGTPAILAKSSCTASSARWRS